MTSDCWHLYDTGVVRLHSTKWLPSLVYSGTGVLATRISRLKSSLTGIAPLSENTRAERLNNGEKHNEICIYVYLIYFFLAVSISQCPSPPPSVVG